MTKSERTFTSIGLATGWFSIVFQLYLILLNRNPGLSVAETVLQFFSYFTILTNILVALAYTAILFSPNSKWGSFFSKAQTLAAFFVYITIVGLVYNLVLRFQWQPQGLQRVVDELLHLFNPVWFGLYWLFFVPKNTLRWGNLLPWLIYPLTYSIYILIRGALSGLYPYPFMDVNKLGYPQVLTNSGFVCLAFLIVSVFVITFAKLFNRNRG